MSARMTVADLSSCAERSARCSALKQLSGGIRRATHCISGEAPLLCN
jgi:hypothetical protein